MFLSLSTPLSVLSLLAKAMMTEGRKTQKKRRVDVMIIRYVHKLTNTALPEVRFPLSRSVGRGAARAEEGEPITTQRA